MPPPVEVTHLPVRHSIHALREIAEQTGLKPLSQIAGQPGVQAVYRVTVCYGDGRAPDSVATLVQQRATDPELAVVYQGLFDHRPLTHPIDSRRYQAWVLALQKARFDRLADQPNIPFYGIDLWLVERAAGSFLKGVIIAPQVASDAAESSYTTVVRAVETYLPEALRQVG
jgi:hypothetical protein